VRSEKNDVYTTLSLPCAGIEVVPDRPSTQVMDGKIMYGKENTVMQKSILEHIGIKL